MAQYLPVRMTVEGAKLLGQIMGRTFYGSGGMAVEATPDAVTLAYRGRKGGRVGSGGAIHRLYVVSVDDTDWTLECRYLDADGEPTGDAFTVQTFTHDVTDLTWPEVHPPIAAGWPIPAARLRPDGEWYCLWHVIGTCEA